MNASTTKLSLTIADNAAMKNETNKANRISLPLNVLATPSVNL